MIHHPDIAAPRRVVSMPTVPVTHRRGHRAWLGLLSALGLLLSLAASLRAQAAARPDSAAARPKRQLSWTSDRRTFQVGDLLKVAIDEYALAQANKDNVNAASRKRSMTMGISPPSTGTGTSAISDIDGSVGTGDVGESRQHGNASRDSRYVGELPVRVVAVTKEGLLQVQGSKTIDVDKNKQVLTLTGLIRPADVNASDVVRSNVIADAQLSYQSKGGLGKPRNGIVSKLIGLFWP
jgi:flagellar L-ring protein FlgH